MDINGYELTKFFYNELETNEVLQSKCKPTHVSLFMWIVELQNRIGWKLNTIGLPTHNSMTFSCIGNDTTYRNCIRDLVSWGLIIEVTKSKNQHQSRKVSIKTDKLKSYLGQKVKERTEKKKASAPVDLSEALTEAKPKQVGSSNETTDIPPDLAPLSYKTIKTKKLLNEVKPSKPEKSKIDVSQERLDMLWEHFNKKYTMADKPKFPKIIGGVNEDKALVEDDKKVLNKRIYVFFYPPKNNSAEHTTPELEK